MHPSVFSHARGDRGGAVGAQKMNSFQGVWFDGQEKHCDWNVGGSVQPGEAYAIRRADETARRAQV
ncbi:MAG: hypothetical protein Greene041662_85 [Candidatus Peregrinibacteria bacterium Greene0416_62]|nr:MAG: hypothetical protein Greene041662_85 [Candidatus Peregrinibacteria bacterium Greene0416_62]